MPRKCYYCGELLNDSDRVCPACGAQAPPTFNPETVTRMVPPASPTHPVYASQPKASHTGLLGAFIVMALLLVGGLVAAGLYWNKYKQEREKTLSALAEERRKITEEYDSAVNQLKTAEKESAQSPTIKVEKTTKPKVQEVCEVVKETRNVAESAEEPQVSGPYASLYTIDTAGRRMTFDINGNTGSYQFSGTDNVLRTLRLESYNPGSGRLVMKAYLRGRYIGKFSGIYDGSSYNCTFISVKGARINYYLS